MMVKSWLYINQGLAFCVVKQSSSNLCAACGITWASRPCTLEVMGCRVRTSELAGGCLMGASALSPALVLLLFWVLTEDARQGTRVFLGWLLGCRPYIVLFHLQRVEVLESCILGQRQSSSRPCETHYVNNKNVVASRFTMVHPDKSTLC